MIAVKNELEETERKLLEEIELEEQKISQDTAMIESLDVEINKLELDS